MKFSKAVILSVAIVSASAFAPAHHQPSSTTTTLLRQSSSAAEETVEAKKFKKDDRLRMMKNPQFYRNGFKEVRPDAEKKLNDEYMSDIVKDLRTSNYVMEKDGVKVYLAKVSRES